MQLGDRCPLHWRCSLPESGRLLEKANLLLCEFPRSSVPELAAEPPALGPEGHGPVWDGDHAVGCLRNSLSYSGSKALKGFRDVPLSHSKL